MQHDLSSEQEMSRLRGKGLKQEASIKSMDQIFAPPLGITANTMEARAALHKEQPVPLKKQEYCPESKAAMENNSNKI